MRDYQNHQPNRLVQIDRSNHFSRDLILACYATARDCTQPPYNYVYPFQRGTAANRELAGGSGNFGSAIQWNAPYLPGSNPGGTYYGGRMLNASRFNGTNGTAFIPFDLSPYAHITLAFWACKNDADTGEIAIEYTLTVGSNNAFYFAPDASDGSSEGPQFALSDNGGANLGKVTGNGVNHPATGVWHHYLFTVNTTTTSWPAEGAKQFVDGLQGNFPGTGNAVGGGGYTFATNGGLYFGARGGSSLWCNVSLANVLIWSRALSYFEAQSLYTSSWQMYTPVHDPWAYGSPFASSANRWFLTG